MLDILRFISRKKIVHTHINFESPVSFPLLSVFCLTSLLESSVLLCIVILTFVDLFVSKSRRQMFCVVLAWQTELYHLHSTVHNCSYPAQHKFLRSNAACTCMNKFVFSRHTRKHLHFYICWLFDSPNKKQ